MIVVLITTVTVEGVLHTEAAIPVSSRRCSTLLPELVVVASSETLDESPSAEELVAAASSRELVGVVKTVAVSVLGIVLTRG